MRPDDEVCLCFHVTQRKILNYLRVEQPRRASQLSGCFGAGTGCGWCRPTLARMLDEFLRTATLDTSCPEATTYAQGRARYLRETQRQPPPGATPPPDDRDECGADGVE